MIRPQPNAALAAILEADEANGVDVFAVAEAPSRTPHRTPRPFVIDPPPWSPNYVPDADDIARGTP